ncbi:hypothetical protein EJ04DRAFT_600070 [Polyplosphaeria fusca]|uniref:Uncharacterized protein n=1 Tax=Polyplosphaeria fusca TaxID=682080 RepID=A0A9P4V3X2_9PLEO|nr:hypothetical protein EJ04DRAFT_600070 [Polyplosphaeria fusca]
MPYFGLSSIIWLLAFDELHEQQLHTGIYNGEIISLAAFRAFVILSFAAFVLIISPNHQMPQSKPKLEAKLRSLLDQQVALIDCTVTEMPAEKAEINQLWIEIDVEMAKFIAGMEAELRKREAEIRAEINQKEADMKTEMIEMKAKHKAKKYRLKVEMEKLKAVVDKTKTVVDKTKTVVDKTKTETEADGPARQVGTPAGQDGPCGGLNGGRAGRAKSWRDMLDDWCREFLYT